MFIDMTNMGVMIHVYDLANSRDQWCAYEISTVATETTPPEVIYCNICKLVDLFNFKDARDNSEFASMYKDGGGLVVRIIALADNIAEASHVSLKHMRSMPQLPRCNLRGHVTTAQRRTIYCSNGAEYATQAEASTALGIPQPNISRVLTGKAKSTRGYSFTYIKE